MKSASAFCDVSVAASEPARAEPWIGYLLNQTAFQIRTATAAALEHLGLTPPMLRALEVIARSHRLTQVQLGAEVQMNRTTIVHVVDRFEALGYARRTPDVTDRRSHALVLTPEGNVALGEARRLAREAEGDFLAPLSSRERTQLIHLLAKLHEPNPCQEEAK
jgi:DNA-binding MarR family transcriptional regulator